MVQEVVVREFIIRIPEKFWAEILDGEQVCIELEDGRALSVSLVSKLDNVLYKDFNPADRKELLIQLGYEKDDLNG